MKPILFSTPMVQAILAGSKTQTRRVIKAAEPRWIFDCLSDDMEVTAVDRNGDEYGKPVDGLFACLEDSEGLEFPVAKSRYRIGDVLWVRETWRPLKWAKKNPYCYKADLTEQEASLKIRVDPALGYEKNPWKPSIHMPLAAARLFLRVTDVRVEKLQKISPEDCVRCRGNGCKTALHEIRRRKMPCHSQQIQTGFSKTVG